MAINCDTCGQEFTPARADARYCSGRCRTIAYRKRNQPEAAPRKRRPLTEAFNETASALYKLGGRLGRLTADDRFPRNRERIAGHDLLWLRMARERIDAAIAELSQHEAIVTDAVELVDTRSDAPRPFKLTDTESLESVAGELAVIAGTLCSPGVIRPDHLDPVAAAEHVARARQAWAVIDRQMSAYPQPSQGNAV